jgi:NTP pyrophosphatase (non-canonical NTP hydrolase)
MKLDANDYIPFQPYKEPRMELAQLQAEHKPWAKRNFPNDTPDQMLIGVMEELGELSHAFLKGAQKIRKGASEDGLKQLQALERDAVGDIVIYLCAYCDLRGLSLAECVERAWNEVKHRDWVNNKEDGRVTTT